MALLDCVRPRTAALRSSTGRPVHACRDGDAARSDNASPRLCEGCALLRICGHMGADGDGPGELN
jgi:hypothetical protein